MKDALGIAACPNHVMGGLLPPELGCKPSHMQQSSRLPVREHMPGHHTSIHLPTDAQKMYTIQQKKKNVRLMYAVSWYADFFAVNPSWSRQQEHEMSYIIFPLEFICSLDGQHMHSSQAAFSANKGLPLRACEMTLTNVEGDHACQHTPAHSARSAESQLVQVPVLLRMDIQARPKSNSMSDSKGPGSPVDAVLRISFFGRSHNR